MGKAFQKIISKNVDVYPQIGGVSPEILETMTFHFFMYTLVVHPLEIWQFAMENHDVYHLYPYIYHFHGCRCPCLWLCMWTLRDDFSCYFAIDRIPLLKLMMDDDGIVHPWWFQIPLLIINFNHVCSYHEQYLPFYHVAQVFFSVWQTIVD